MTEKAITVDCDYPLLLTGLAMVVRDSGVLNNTRKQHIIMRFPMSGDGSDGAAAAAAAAAPSSGGMYHLSYPATKLEHGRPSRSTLMDGARNGSAEWVEPNAPAQVRDITESISMGD
eukprot:COSAG01_NODE_363_length_18113_cov_45.041690_19_plen_117_part_00